jgi:hypothetical protein
MKITIEKKAMAPMADPMDQKIMELGKERNDMKEMAYETVAPSGKYSVMGLNSLVTALNTVLPMFGIPDYAKFTETVMTLPGEFVKMLTMVNDAATQAGVDEAVVDLSTIVDDKGLKMAAGKLMTLAANTAFKQFLRSAEPMGTIEPKEEEEEDDKEEESGPMASKAMGMAADDMMMSRMS